MGASSSSDEGQVETQAARGGRPRSEQVHQAILKTAFDLVLRDGFRTVSIECIAATAGVSKATIYRRWPNKAAVVMDAFTDKVGSGTLFHKASTAAESIRLQMRAMARSFRGSDGALVKALLAESQFDPELAKALRERWTLPRRRLAAEVIREAILQGDVHPDVDPEDAIDILYGPIYYRLERSTGPLSNAYVDGIFHAAMQGLGTKNNKAKR